MNMNETENQIRLRRAKEALDIAMETEREARRSLHDAEGLTRRAKERWRELFLREEQEECARRKADYMHGTK